MDLNLSGCLAQVHDPDLALAFCRDVLGLELRNDVAREGFRWITVGAASQPGVGIVLTNYLKVRASGAKIVQEPTEQPWGTRDFAVRDPSGNLVRIDQPPAAWS
jgi:catechol 2,3-dioxygenase-like lactoylglutathione lyase family enzyme